MSRYEYKHKLLFLVNKRDYFHHQYYIYNCLLKLLSERISHDHLHIFGMYKIFIGMLTTNKDWLDRNRDNVTEWGDMSVRRVADCCFSELTL
jgi:hypothetical protein